MNDQQRLIPLETLEDVEAGRGPSAVLDPSTGDAYELERLPYIVKCDECRQEIRRCETVAESARGGHCDACRAELDARYPERVENRGGLTRRERLEARAERRREWAESRQAKSSAAVERVHAIADGIPFGQPILVGHHSERRARRDQERMHAGMSAAVEHGRQAEEHAAKADGIEAQLARSIYSDDVDAVDRLEERIAELEAERDRWKAYNAKRRRGAAVTADMLDERQRAEVESLARIGYLGPKGELPGYVLQNLGANIRRNRERLEQIKRDNERRDAGDRGRGRSMFARFSSSCADCGETIDKGAAITYYRLTREAVHAECPQEVS